MTVGVKVVVVTGDLEHLCVFDVLCIVVLVLSQKGGKEKEEKGSVPGAGDNFMGQVRCVRWVSEGGRSSFSQSGRLKRRKSRERMP